MNKDSRINYERNLRLIFMEYVAFKIAENSIWDFKELDSFLSEFISGNNRRKKAVTMLKKIWLPKNRIQNQALILLPELSEQERLFIYWGVINYTYPFFKQIVRTMGKYFFSQKRVKTAQVKRRIKEIYGDRRYVEICTEEVITTVKDWGLIKMESPGLYTAPPKIKITSTNLINWILETLLSSTDMLVSPYPAIVRGPELFPFEIKVNTHEVKKNDIFEIERHGVDKLYIGIHKKSKV